MEDLNVNEMTHKELKAMTSKEWRSLGYVVANEILSPMKPIQRLEVLKNAPSRMTPYEQWIKRSKSQIIQFYMNARVTCSCGGHWKGEQNARLVGEYSKTMKTHNIPMPSSDICYVMGIFNGEGSY